MITVVGSGRDKCKSPRSQRTRAFARGFTLLELLVVVVIAGITLGMVSFNAFQGSGKAVQQEAQRIALLLQLGREEAILRNRPVAFEADAERYRFLVRDENGNGWQALTDDNMLHEREFKQAPMQLTISPPQDNPGSAQVRLVFGREPVDKPFVMTLSLGDAGSASAAGATIRADGVGHFLVE